MILCRASPPVFRTFSRVPRAALQPTQVSVGRFEVFQPPALAVRGVTKHRHTSLVYTTGAREGVSIRRASRRPPRPTRRPAIQAFKREFPSPPQDAASLGRSKDGVLKRAAAGSGVPEEPHSITALSASVVSIRGRRHVPDIQRLRGARAACGDRHGHSAARSGSWPQHGPSFDDGTAGAHHRGHAQASAGTSSRRRSGEGGIDLHPPMPSSSSGGGGVGVRAAVAACGR